MKNCPLCGHEYYDEAKWCPECEYDFPAGGPAVAAPSLDEVAAALEKLAAGADAGAGAAISAAERIDRLYRAADEDPNRIWKLSPEHLHHVREYEWAVSLLERWKKARA